MRVTEECLIFLPIISTDEVTAVEDLQLIHFITTLSIETQSIEIDCTLVYQILRVRGGISKH